MKTVLTVTACTVLLAACNEPVPAESVESLMANPERLKDVRAQCNMAAEATRRRFMGSGTPYTPTPTPTPASPATPRSAPKD